MSDLAARLRSVPTAGRPADEPTHSGLWGGAAPDAPDLQPTGPITALSVARNVTPREDGSYGPWGAQEVLGNALQAIVKGSISLTDSSAVSWTFAGDGSRGNLGDLYESNDYQFTKVSKGGTSYVVNDDEYWGFTEFDTLVIATTVTAPLQAKTKGVAGNFADLITGTNKPQARHIATIGNFVVLGNTFDSTDGAKLNRVWWSGFRDPTTFDPSTSTQSDFEDLPEGGRVQALVGGQEYGTIMQSNMIRRMTYRGDAAIWDFDPVDRTRGTPIPRSVAARGRLLAYIAEEGFMLFDGLTSTEIGDGKVDRSFWNEFDTNDRNSVSAAIDPVQKLILWAYPANGGTNRLPNKLVIYNYGKGSNRWSTIDIECDMVTTGFLLGLNVDSPDPRLSNIDTSVWANRSMDSIIFKGGFTTLASYDLEHRFSTFDGPALAMRMESKDLSLFTGQSGMINKARPLVEGLVRSFIGTRNVQGGEITYLPSKEKGKNGLCHFADQKTTARYHRYCLEADAGAEWDKASGYQLYAQPRGVYIGD